MHRFKHIIPCGGLTLRAVKHDQAHVLPLNLWSRKGVAKYIDLKMEDLHSKLYKAVPPEFEDLIEIAAYVYCADQATRRGGKNVDQFGDAWRRDFLFKIPVRRPDFWERPEVKSTLQETLEFLSDDFFDFEFLPAGTNAPPMTEYFPNLVVGGPGDGVEGVMLFSGGLDSLAGAIEESVGEKRRVLLVTHKPTEKLNNVHAKLRVQLNEKSQAFPPTHLYVRINKDSDLNRNYTQRARSFLYAAVGATVAHMQGLDRFKFYENGVVTMNLPVCAQVVGSRATRTTHPRVLAGFAKLFSLLVDGPFRVENPFIWDTKADVIKRILKHGCGELIESSISCAHTWTYSHAHPHCGTCSQCIDRRIGIVAAGVDDLDPATKYASDVFVGSRPTEEDRMMMATYAERANEISKLANPNELIVRFPDVVRILGFLEGKPGAMAAKVFDLHKRHAKEVNSAIERMLAFHSKEVRERTLPRDCLLRLIYDSGGGVVSPVGNQPALQRQQERWESETEGEDVYRLSKGIGWWTLVFQGKQDVIADDRGMNLINYLLKNPPDEPIHALELELRVDGVPDSSNAVAMDSAADNGELGRAYHDDINGGMIKEGAGKALMGTVTLPEMKQLVSELKRNMEDNSLPELERDAARKEWQELLSAYAKGGKMGGQAGRAVDRVRKAIKAKIGTLKKPAGSKGSTSDASRAFAAHLETYLWLPSMGARGRTGASGRAGCFTYEPPNGVKWKG